MRIRATHFVLPSYLLATMLFTWPVIRTADRSVPSSRVLFDTRAQAFIVGWDWHALRTNPSGLFSPPIFYPEPNALTYMDHLLGETFVAAPFLASSDSVAPAYNFLVFLSFMLSAWGMYRLTRLFHVSRPAAYLAGLLFAFSPYRFTNIDQLNLLQTEFFPWGAWFAIRFLQRHRARDLVALAAICVLQVYFGWYYTYYLAIMLGVLCAYALAQGRLDPRRMRLLLVGAIGVACALLVLPVVLPYVLEHRALPEYKRSLKEAEIYSASGLDYLRVNRNAVLAKWVPFAVAEQSYFPGVVTILLAMFGGLRILRAGRGGPETASRTNVLQRIRAVLVQWGWEGYFLVLAFTAYVLSLGPYLHVLGHRIGIPLPYAALFHVVPGFASMRAPGRLAVLVLMALVVLAALGYEELRRRSGGRRAVAWKLVVVGIFLAAVISSAQKPTSAVELPTATRMPPVYEWLARQPGATPILELPASAQIANETEVETLRQYYLLFHGKPRLDGSSGFVSPRYRAFRVAMRSFPDDGSLRAAAEMGARLLVVHFADYAPEARAALRTRIGNDARLVAVAAFGDDEVFRLE